MSNAFFQVPLAKNEPVKQFTIDSIERRKLKETLDLLKSKSIKIPMIIDGKEVYGDQEILLTPPHDHKHKLGIASKGTKEHVQMAIDAALNAKDKWSNLSWESRMAIFLKAAELLKEKHRYLVLASTMLAQSKNCFQAEIDAACELIDFFLFNVQFATEIYKEQPISAEGMWNRMEYRPLEGFVLAVTPFNFTSIAANLPTSVAMMGNTVVWKCSNTQIYSAHFLMNLLIEAGLPNGVINLIFSSGKDVGEICFKNKDFAGVHFTGSTKVFQEMWRSIGENISNYKSYPRIVGETGGKDFVFAHPSACPKALSTALIRGAFEYQGQKCSAASRAYIPNNLWDEVKKIMIEDLKSIKMGTVENFSNFINAVIDESSFDNLKKYIDEAKDSKQANIVFGGNCNKSIGYFIEPTIIQALEPDYITMKEELFGPVLSIYVYEEQNWKETLDIVDNTSPYALTGAIFSQDRYEIEFMTKKLENCAGNYYINDKPTGAVVGQQPFGGARASGTNDKAGSKLNLLRWVNMRTIKETFVPPIDYKYPFLND